MLTQGLTLGVIVFAAVLAAMFAYGAIEKARIRSAIDAEIAREEQIQADREAAADRAARRKRSDAEAERREAYRLKREADREAERRGAELAEEAMRLR